jgi:hypothetical protein
LEGWFKTLWFDLSALILDGNVNKNYRLPLKVSITDKPQPSGGAGMPTRFSPSHPASPVALYLARRKTDLSLNEIGVFFEERHYTADHQLVTPLKDLPH